MVPNFLSGSYGLPLVWKILLRAFYCSSSCISSSSASAAYSSSICVLDFFLLSLARSSTRGSPSLPSGKSKEPLPSIIEVISCNLDLAASPISSPASGSLSRSGRPALFGSKDICFLRFFSISKPD